MRTTHFIFYIGHGFLNNLILSAEFVVATNTIKLKCLSSKEPINHVADFFVDHVSADIVTLSRGKCYHSLGECSENICMCSKDEFSFTWMFNPTDTLQTYKLGCEVRSFDEITNQIVTTQASMVFDGSGNGFFIIIFKLHKLIRQYVYVTLGAHYK